MEDMSTVIIEGPDGAGKTRLVEALLDRYPAYRAAPRPCTSLGGPLEWDEMAAYLELYGQLDQCIYDRYPSISGAVYDAVFTRHHPESLSDSLQNYFHWVIENTRIIYCRPPMDNIVSAVHASPQLIGVRQGIYRIVDMYDSLMANLIPHERYDWTENALPSL